MEDKMDDILELIEQMEKSSSKSILRKAKDSTNKDIENTLTLLINLFKKTNKSIKDKVELILEYNDDYNMEKLLKDLNITFLEYNSIISETADDDIVEKVDKILSSIISEMTELKNSNNKSNEEKKVILRNSNLDSDAEEFANKLFNNLYGKK